MGEIPFKARRKKPLPIPWVVTRIYRSGFVPPVSEFTPVKFSLHKIGQPSRTDIRVHMGLQSWSLSAALNRYPKTFNEARLVVQQVAASHGYEAFEEIKRVRVPRARGGDRRVLRDGGCREAWLGSVVPELWAEAMVRCKHAGGFCGQDGYCHFGDCNMEMKLAKQE